MSKRWDYIQYVSFSILIEINLSVIGSQFEFPEIKFYSIDIKIHFCQIEGVGPFQVQQQTILFAIDFKNISYS